MLKLAPCGDDCNLCPRYLAIEDHSEERLREVAAMWRMVGWGDVEKAPEGITCNGCESVEFCGLGCKKCTEEKSIDNCGECPDYPCENMLKIFERNVKEAQICKENFPEKDRDLYQRAFWDKKKRLDEIHGNLTDNIL